MIPLTLGYLPPVALRRISNPGGGKKSQGQFVAIRKQGFGLSAEFARAANVKEFPHVEVLIDDDERAIVLSFIREATEHSYEITPDGGSSQDKDGRFIGFPVRKHAWIKAVSELDSPSDRRFRPTRGTGSRWVVTLPPGFDERASGPNGVPADAFGIYRYVDEYGEVIYIGEGVIRDRISNPEREAWRYKWIEYSVIGGEERKRLSEYWEKYWLDRHQRLYGELPFHNRIGGKDRDLA